ncbi:N-acetyltransferase [Bacillus sp. HMF5848]|nr:N-acetyltransferase [Bacillus sp. HMF5848]
MHGKRRLLEGERIYLKPIEEQHIDDYYGKLSNASIESFKYTGSKAFITKQGLSNYVKNICSNDSRLDFFIIDKQDDEIVGEVVLNDIDWKNRSASTRIGIFQEEDCNKKFGTEALSLLLQYGFGMYQLHRIELQVYSFNERAIRVYEKLGFKQEGVLRDCLFYNNQYHDAIVMSILETEFNK